MTPTAYVVQGRKDSGGTFPRLEIRELEKKPKQWALFLLSLQIIQNPDSIVQSLKDFDGIEYLKSKSPIFVSLAAKFVKIGGIHGLPYERWEGDPASGPTSKAPEAIQVQETLTSVAAPSTAGTEAEHGTESSSATPEMRFGGYCNHASILFPPWHRPHLMAIEQSIGEIATALAPTFIPPQGSTSHDLEWIQAAKELRFPFWDWTLDSTKEGLPRQITDENITIDLPGTQKTIKNPLATFHFGDTLPSGFENIQATVPPHGETVTAYFADWKRTCRWPKSETTPNDDYSTLKTKLSNQYDDIRSKVAHLFAFGPDSKDYPRMWDEFSNTTFQSNPTTSKSKGKPTPDHKSIEAPHNSIHLYVGGVGHMSQNDYAGFDPVFFLHHANVDRIYALWEYVYPDYWMGAGYFEDDKDNTDEKKLCYFTQPTGGTWSLLDKSRVDQASDILPFRKELDAYWTASDGRSLLSDAKTNKWYTYPPVEGVQVDKPGATPDQLKKYRSDLQKHFGLNPSSIKGAKGMPIFEQQPISIPNGKKAIEKYRHFIIAVALVEHALNASYTLEIDYKLGEEVKYGHVAVLTRSESSSCAGCAGRRAAGNIVHGIIHLPATHVVEIVAHRSGNDDEINHLKKHLTARLVTAAGIVYASTEDGLDTKNALDESITPELVLHSAFACLDDDKDSLGGPVDFFNWQDHGEMFSGKWKKM